MAKKPVRVHANKYEKYSVGGTHTTAGAGTQIFIRDQELLKKKLDHLVAFRRALGVNQDRDRSGKFVDIVVKAKQEGRKLVDHRDFEGRLITDFIHFLQVEAPQVYRDIVDAARKKYFDLGTPAEREAYKREVLARISELMQERGVRRYLRD